MGNVIGNIIVLGGVDVYWQTFVIGATLLAAVLIDRAGKVRAAAGEKARGRNGSARKEKGQLAA